MNLNQLKKAIRSIPDYPQKGIIFRDITPALQDPQLFKFLIDQLCQPYRQQRIDKIVGIDARGFLLSGAMAYQLGAGVAIIRKKGKLPYETLSQQYQLEYGSNTLEIHRDAIDKGESVLVVDDVLATGGTIRAACDLVEKLGGRIIGIALMIELNDLKGRKLLKNYLIHCLINF